MRILALDPSTSTGWATADGLEIRRVEFGCQRFDLKRGESPGMRFIRFRSWLEDMLDTVKPAVICYEQAHHRGGYATQVCVGLTTRIEEMAAARGIEVMTVHTGALKKWAAGNGRASKQDMMSAAMMHWGLEKPPDTDDEADALLILAWCQEELGF